MSRVDQFYESLYMNIVYQWLTCYQKQYHDITFEVDSSDTDRFLFYYQNLIGEIHFWRDQNLIEEIILNEQETLLFYLHYNVNNLLIPQKFIDEFFDFLLKNQKKKHIGMSCSCGITSSLFVENLSQLAQLLNLPYQFDVVPLYEIERIHHDYDMIILAPQTSYLELPLRIKCQNDCQIISIDPTVFATTDYQKALDMIGQKIL